MRARVYLPFFKLVYRAERGQLRTARRKLPDEIERVELCGCRKETGACSRTFFCVEKTYSLNMCVLCARVLRRTGVYFFPTFFDCV